MRYALIVLASLTSVFLWWLAWQAFRSIIEPPRPGFVRGNGLEVLLALFAGAAVIMGAAAFGLVRSHAWAAYLFSVSAFLMLVPILGLLMLSFVAWDVSTPQPPWSLLLIGFLILDLNAGVMGLKLGQSLGGIDPVTLEKRVRVSKKGMVRALLVLVAVLFLTGAVDMLFRLPSPFIWVSWGLGIVVALLTYRGRTEPALR